MFCLYISGYRQIIIAIAGVLGMLMLVIAVAGITILCTKRQRRIKKEKQNAALNLTLEKMDSSPSLKRHPFNEIHDSPKMNPIAAYGVIEWCNTSTHLKNSSDCLNTDYMSIRRSSPARSPIAVRIGNHGNRSSPHSHAYHMVVCSDSDESHSVTVWYIWYTLSLYDIILFVKVCTTCSQCEFTCFISSHYEYHPRGPHRSLLWGYCSDTSTL